MRNTSVVFIVKWSVGAGFTSRMCQLNSCACALGVHEFDNGRQRITLGVVPQAEILGRNPSLGCNGGGFDNGPGHSPAGQTAQMRHVPIGGNTVIVVSAVLTHGWNQEPVPGGHPT